MDQHVSLEDEGMVSSITWVVGRSSCGLVMVPIIVKEGIEALGGKTCCDDEKCKLTVSHPHEDTIDVR